MQLGGRLILHAGVSLVLRPYFDSGQQSVGKFGGSTWIDFSRDGRVVERKENEKKKKQPRNH